MHESGTRGYGDVDITTAADLETLAEEMESVKVTAISPFELTQAARLVRDGHLGVATAPALEIVHGLVEHGKQVL